MHTSEPLHLQDNNIKQGEINCENRLQKVEAVISNLYFRIVHSITIPSMESLPIFILFMSGSIPSMFQTGY